MKEFGPWDTYCAMVDVLETRFPPGVDIPEKARYFLSEANPRIWQGEVSGDPAIYELSALLNTTEWCDFVVINGQMERAVAAENKKRATARQRPALVMCLHERGAY